MSTKDSDFKRKVEQAATIQLGASFLKILQACPKRLASFGYSTLASEEKASEK